MTMAYSQHEHRRASFSPFSHGIVVAAVLVVVLAVPLLIATAHAMRLPEKLPLALSFPCRARFLSSTAAAFVASVAFVSVGANDPSVGVCEAASTLFIDNDKMKTSSSINDDNPRYIDKELQMKYGEGPGMYL